MAENQGKDHLKGADVSTFKIFIIGNRGYASAITEKLLKKGEDVAGICSKTESSYSILKSYLRAILVKYGVYPNNGCGYKNPFNSFRSPKDIAADGDIPYFDAAAIKTPQFKRSLKDIAPDIVLVAGFHRLIPADIIVIPKRGMINFHPSLLPKHRGGTPGRWVIRNGESETGLTAHFVNEQFDRGDIVLQEKLAVDPNETWGELEMRTSDVIVRMACHIVEMAKNGPLNAWPQDEKKASYESSFRGINQKIDWVLPAREIRQICNAIKPKSSGISTYKGKVLCPWDIVVMDDVTSNRTAGTVLSVDCGSVLVMCGKGALKITSFLYHGKIVNTKEIISKHHIQEGAVLQ